MTSSSHDEHAAALALLWERRTPPTRGPKPTLDIDTITRTGIEIADADGLMAVTMHRVATATGVTKMALYRYVPGKDELIALMTDAAIGQPPRSRARDGWRPAMRKWTISLLERFRAHPWLLRTSMGARPIGPHELDWMEQASAALAGTGLDGGEALDVTVTLVGHVRMAAGHEADSPAGTTEETMAVALGALLRGREDRYPALTEGLSSAAKHGSRDQSLEFGLERILDGVAHLIATRARA